MLLLTATYVIQFILGSRSEYFRAMFASGMEEATSSRVVIDDCAYDAVVEMIRFLHTGTAAVNKVFAQCRMLRL